MGSPQDTDEPEIVTKSPKTTVTQSRSLKDGAIYLYQRSDYKKPTWLYRVKRPNGNGFVNGSTRTGDEHQAYSFANDVLHRLIAESYGQPRSKGTKIGPVIDTYIEWLESQPQRLSINYKILLMKRIRSFFAKRVFEDLSTAVLNQLITVQAANSKKGALSPNSVKRIFSDLKHFFNWCAEAGHLDAPPRFPKISGNQARRPHFDASEWKRLLQGTLSYLKESHGSVRRDRHLLLLYVIVLAETGIRTGEARGLRWRDIRPLSNSNDLDAANIALLVRGKTGIREVVASGPKVREAIGEILKIRSKDLKDARSDICELDEVPLEGFIFSDMHGKPIRSFKKSFATFLDHEGLTFDTFGRRRTIYSLRHTYATSRLEAGVNHYVLAKNMGTSVPMLEAYYGHTTNVGMVDELTKPKAKRSEKGTGMTSELSWLHG